MDTYVIIRQVKPDENVKGISFKPEIKFIGSKMECQSVMFRIIMESENGYKRVENDNGIEIEVNEIVPVSIHDENCSKKVPVIYYFYYYSDEITLSDD